MPIASLRMATAATLALALAAPPAAQSAPDSPSDTSLTRSIPVPFDHSTPALGSAALTLDLGARFDASKPTVLVIADGQQYYVRPGAMRALQTRLFGDRVNVVGIVPRGQTAAFVTATLRPDGTPDWARAWRIFNSAQWVEDIEHVRRALVGERGTVLLYGRSGGGYLVHEYLLRHGARVRRAFTQAPVCPALNRELGIPYDRWWLELRDRDPELHATLRGALARDTADRVPLLITLQRLHFFVPADSFEITVRRLARAVAAGDTAAYARARAAYQTDAVLELERSTASVAMRVRELELIEPAGGFEPRDPEAIAPLLETQAVFVAPLLEQLRSGALRSPAFDLRPAHRLATEVCIVTGRWDEAVDYRTSIALAATYPRHRLVIADDNHTLSGLTEAGLVRGLVESFLTAGLDSAAFRAALAAAAPRLWTNGD